MKKNLLILILFFIGGCSSIYVDMNVGEGYMEMNIQEGYYESEIYSAAFSLPRLRSTNNTELRIWINNYDTWTISAFIVSKANSKQCQARIKQTIGSEYEYRIIPEKCERKAIKMDLNTLQEIADILSHYDKQSISCPDVLGGRGGIIEGVSREVRFSFKIFNPEKCNTPATKEITRALELLRATNR